MKIAKKTRSFRDLFEKRKLRSRKESRESLISKAEDSYHYGSHWNNQAWRVRGDLYEVPRYDNHAAESYEEAGKYYLSARDVNRARNAFLHAYWGYNAVANTSLSLSAIGINRNREEIKKSADRMKLMVERLEDLDYFRLCDKY